MQPSLETLRICAEDDVTRDYTLVAADLTAIQCCSGLQMLSIVVIGDLHLDDLDIESFVKYLPQLQDSNYSEANISALQKRRLSHMLPSQQRARIFDRSISASTQPWYLS